jgi:hypothetical protein
VFVPAALLRCASAVLGPIETRAPERLSRAGRERGSGRRQAGRRGRSTIPGKITAAPAAAVTLGGDRLADIAVLREQPWRLTIRDFLAHWGQTRRTGTVNALIRSDLADKGLTTRPPFTEGRVEDEIEIIPVDTTS